MSNAWVRLTISEQEDVDVDLDEGEIGGGKVQITLPTVNLMFILGTAQS